MIDSPNAESIGTCETKFDMDQDARQGSRALGEAINSLFERMPARKVAEVIGKAHLCEVPGLQPVLRGQLAQRRLAA